MVNIAEIRHELSIRYGLGRATLGVGRGRMPQGSHRLAFLFLPLSRVFENGIAISTHLKLSTGAVPGIGRATVLLRVQLGSCMSHVIQGDNDEISGPYPSIDGFTLITYASNCRPCGAPAGHHFGEAFDFIRTSVATKGPLEFIKVWGSRTRQPFPISRQLKTMLTVKFCSICTSPWVLVFSFCFCTIVFLRLSRSRRPALPFPPGPKGLPIIGNVLDMPRAHPWLTYWQWGKQCSKFRVCREMRIYLIFLIDSDIVHASTLGTHIIVLNSAKAVRELLEKRSSIYSDRYVMFLDLPKRS
jgi:hypothetical protein